MRNVILVLSILLLILPLTGCWDRKEINDLALVMSKGVDMTPDGKIRVSVQIAIPSKVGGSQTGSGKGEAGKSFFVVTGTGRTVLEADTRIQQKLPRQLYTPHLRIVLVGDRIARNGIAPILDHLGRNPSHRLRTAFLVARGTDAVSLLKTAYPLESISGEAVRKMEHQLLGTNTNLLDFMIQASSEGMDQYASAMSLLSQSDQNGPSSNDGGDLGFYNQAIFKDLKLVGYLNSVQSIVLQWMNERLRYATLTVKLPQVKGSISVEVTQCRRQARTFVRGNQVAVQYQLSAAGLLNENTTGLDADDPRIIKMFQDALNQYVERIAQDCLQTLYKQFDADPTGVGQMVYHQHPYDWERFKTRWHEKLPTVQYNVSSQVKIVEGGKSGPPLYGKPHRGIKSHGATSEQLGGSTQ